jgi:S-DNA-T family DNA segregation ATPase FtsK/SpoIIIE
MSFFNHSQEQKEFAQQITDTYARFGVKIGELLDVYCGPRVTRYEFALSQDTKVSKITTLRDDISLMLSVPKVRIICPIPNRMAFAIEVANKTEPQVNFEQVFDSTNGKLSLVLGQNLSQKSAQLDLSKAPHLLIGGCEGSGKTTLLKSMITGLILRNSQDELKLLFITPKPQELTVFENYDHLLSPIISDAGLAIDALGKLLNLCEERLSQFKEKAVRNIDAYNSLSDDKLAKIVAVIDEYSFLTKFKATDFELIISKIAQIGRMAGIHLILSTKELSSKTLTGIIKANIPTRLALATKNAMESRTIIDCTDAECLLLKGDMLLSEFINKPTRIQAAFITDEQIKALI